MGVTKVTLLNTTNTMKLLSCCNVNYNEAALRTITLDMRIMSKTPTLLGKVNIFKSKCWNLLSNKTTVLSNCPVNLLCTQFNGWKMQWSYCTVQLFSLHDWTVLWRKVGQECCAANTTLVQTTSVQTTLVQTTLVYTTLDQSPLV